MQSLFCIIFLCFFFQLIDVFGSLLDRPFIHEDFGPKYSVLLNMVEKELDEAKVIFDKQMSIESEQGSAPVNKNMPYVAGSLKWAQELRNRFKTPMSSLKMSVNHGYVNLNASLLILKTSV